MKPLCVIPARGGSKRLPRKNILPLHNKPMLAYSIEAALASKCFDRVLVSTEDREIGRIAREYGAQVHERPEHLAGDMVSATDVCIEAAGEHYDSIVCLQPSSPLRSVEDIRACCHRFDDCGADFLVSVTMVDPHYFHWAVRPDGEWWRMHFGSQYLAERSLLPEIYRPNGSIKIGRAGPLRALRNFFGPKLAAYQTPEERSLHVATQFDFDFASYLLSTRQS